MSQLALDDNGDIAISNNKFSIIDGQAEVRQKLIQRLQTFLEEWFLDVNLGIPYLQLIFVKGTPASVIADLFKNTIISTPGVTQLTRFEPLELNAKRELDLDFDVKTSFGEDAIKIQESVP